MGRVDLVYEELSFKIRGIIYQVHNELGQHRNEKQYCDNIEFKLNEHKLNFEREKQLPESFEGEKKGRNRLDFVIEDKIILEVKAVPSFSREDYSQCLRYLVSSDKELALLVNFSLPSCVIKRILNPNLLSNQ